MIMSFGSSETQGVWLGKWVKNLPVGIQAMGQKKLEMLNRSLSLKDLYTPPSNRLEKLSGKRKDFYSIRINNQWRIIFKWVSGHVYEVEIIDYH
jgi:proteic killer suppression protein